MTIQGQSGFGDAIYLQPIVDKYARENPSEIITVQTSYPEVFLHLKNVQCNPYNYSTKIDDNVSYLGGKTNLSTKQVDDMGYDDNIKKNYITQCRRVVLVCTGYPAMGSVDELVPYEDAVQDIIDDLADDNAKIIHLANDSTHNYKKAQRIVSDSFEQTVMLFRGADYIVCQQGWAVALAEGLKKECLVLYTRRAKNPPSKRGWLLGTITPGKIIYRPETTSWMYVD